MIIIGYQGVGKSTYCRSHEDSIDLESSNFWFYDKETKQKSRWHNWAEIYANIAVDLSKQGNYVFTSCHQVVRDELAKKDYNEHIVILIPSLELKDKWIKKLEKRYNDTKLEKDYKAWKNAEDRYTENINEHIEDAKKYNWDIFTIMYEYYELNDYINEYLYNHDEWED